MFPNAMAMHSMTGMQPGTKKKTHRGTRGGKNKKKAVNAHHAQAQQHLQNAADALTPQTALVHMFKGLTALNKAKGATLPASAGVAMPAQPQMASQAPLNQVQAQPNG